MSKESFVIKSHFYIYIVFILTIASCSNNPEQQNKQKSGAKDTPDILSVSLFKPIPILSRELLQENNTYYAEEDCFCSNRVLVFDTIKKDLRFFSWCKYKESPVNDPDFGVYTFEKVLPDSSLQFLSSSGVSTEFQCIQLKTSGTDSLMTLHDCNSQKKYFFTSIRLLKNYEVRVPDCSDVQG
jgi:hypothetical protein